MERRQARAGNTATAIARHGGDVIATYCNRSEEAEAVVTDIRARGRQAVALQLDTEAQFDGLVNVHFKGVYFLTQTLLPLITGGRRIINLSSGLTRVSFPGYAAYAAVKAAVEVLSVDMAKELGSRKITVNTVAPGAIETDFGGGAVRDHLEVNKIFADMTALGRAGVPDDIGPMIASLLSGDNRWVNAQRIEVSGGQGI